MKHTPASSLIGVREMMTAESRAFGRGVASTVVYASRTQARVSATRAVVVWPRYRFSSRIMPFSETNHFPFVICAQSVSWLYSSCTVTRSWTPVTPMNLDPHALVSVALEYQVLSPAARLLAQHVFRYTVQLGLEQVEYRTRRVIEYETGLSDSSQSKAFAELERAGILKRDRTGRGPFQVNVQSEFWRWNGRWVRPSMVDVAVCKDTVAGKHPLQQWMRSRCLMPSAQKELFAKEAGLTDALKEVAREELAELSSQESSRERNSLSSGVSGTSNRGAIRLSGERRDRKGGERQVSQAESSTTSNDHGNDTETALLREDDLVHCAREAFGSRCTPRLERLIVAYGNDSRKACRLMLERAIEYKRKGKTIRIPHAWCHDVFTRIKMKLGRGAKRAV